MLREHLLILFQGLFIQLISKQNSAFPSPVFFCNHPYIPHLGQDGSGK